jgi:hypothetical protein
VISLGTFHLNFCVGACTCLILSTTFRRQPGRATTERMSGSHTKKVAEVDPRSVGVNLSPEVRRALGDLAAAVQFSEHFDGDTLLTLQDLASGKQLSVFDVFTAFPLIAEETFKHIHATGDKLAAAAWHEIGSELLERGFTLANFRLRTK